MAFVHSHKMSGANQKLARALRQQLSLLLSHKPPKPSAKGSVEHPRWLVKGASESFPKGGARSSRSKGPWFGVACVGVAGGAVYAGMHHYGISISDLFPEKREVHVVPAELAIPMPPLNDNR